MSNETLLEGKIRDWKKELFNDVLDKDPNMNIEFHGPMVYIHECMNTQVLKFFCNKYNAIFTGDKIQISLRDMVRGKDDE